MLVPEQAGQVTQRYMFMETLFHELAHSLGPGTIVVGGRKTTVDKELKDIAGGFEEAKADVMGAYNVMHMMDKGVIPAAERPQIRATYVAGLFRAMRFGTNEAHGKGAAMQYRYLRDKGAIVWDAAGQALPHRRGEDRRRDPRPGRRDRPAAGRRRLCRDQGVPRQMGRARRRGEPGDRHDDAHPGRHPPGLSGADLI